MKTNDLYIVKEIDPDNLPEGEVIAVNANGKILKGHLQLRLDGNGIVCSGRFSGTMYSITHYLAPVTLAELNQQLNKV